MVALVPMPLQPRARGLRRHVRVDLVAEQHQQVRVRRVGPGQPGGVARPVHPVRGPRRASGSTRDRNRTRCVPARRRRPAYGSPAPDSRSRSGGHARSPLTSTSYGRRLAQRQAVEHDEREVQVVGTERPRLGGHGAGRDPYRAGVCGLYPDRGRTALYAPQHGPDDQPFGLVRRGRPLLRCTGFEVRHPLILPGRRPGRSADVPTTCQVRIGRPSFGRR